MELTIKTLEEKIQRLEGRIDELSKQIVELNKNSHPMHFSPCQYKETPTPGLPSPSQPPWLGPLGPIVTC